MPKIKTRRKLPLGQKVRMLRIKQGYTQRELAKMVGITYAQISQIETGKSLNPKGSTLQGLAQSLGVNVADLTSLTINN